MICNQNADQNISPGNISVRKSLCPLCLCGELLAEITRVDAGAWHASYEELCCETNRISDGS